MIAQNLRTIQRLMPTLFCAALTLGALGCADKNSASSANAPADTSGTAVDAGGVPTTSSNVVYAKSWTELDIDANSAKNTVDSAGHYHTDHNMCQKSGDGVYDVATWNSVAGALNQVVLSTPLPTPRCWDSPDGSKFYNHGLAEIVTANGRRKIYEYKDRQICTTIADPTIANSLMAQLEATLLLDDAADAKDCPNYRPPVHP